LKRRVHRAALALMGFCHLACLRLEGPPPTLENGEECTSDAMCKAGSVCAFDSAVSETVCRQQDGCTSHAECGVDGACAFGTCGPAECLDNSSCGLYACNLALRRCLDKCTSDSSCASGSVCRDGECLSSTCTEATAARVCNGAACYDGVCMSGINCEDYGCATGYTCESVQCVRPCTSDVECAGYTCVASLGECRRNCGAESDCAAGYVCEDFFCKPAPP
jgi:hypothetical protein